MAKQVLLARLVRRVKQVRLVKQAPPDLLAIPEKLARKGRQVLLALQAPLAKLGQLAQQELPDRRA